MLKEQLESQERDSKLINELDLQLNSLGKEVSEA